MNGDDDDDDGDGDGGGGRIEVGRCGYGNALGHLLSRNDATIMTTTFLTRPMMSTRRQASARGRPPMIDSIKRRINADDVGR